MAVFDPEYKHTGLDRIGNIEQYLVNANGGLSTALLYQTTNVGRNVIVDTDWFTDAGDTVALRVALWMELLGKINILGVALDTTLAAGPASLDAFLVAHGRAGMPIAKSHTSNVPTGTPAWQARMTYLSHTVGGPAAAEDAVTMYRRLLAASTGPVDIIAIGHLNNLADLLVSTADSYSPLTGTQLVQQKVGTVWVVGGQWPNSSGSPEHNFSATAVAKQAAHDVCASWPTPLVFLGFEAGQYVLHGAQLLQSAYSSDIVTLALSDYGQIDGDRAWDAQLVRLAALNSYTAAGYATVRGTASVSASTGDNSWTTSSSGNHYYVVQAQTRDWYERDLDPYVYPPPTQIQVQPRQVTVARATPLETSAVTAGLRLHLNADDLSDLANNAAVVTWPDRMGITSFRAHASGSEPTYLSSKGGKTAVGQSTSGHYMISDPILVPRELTIYASVYFDTLPGADACYLGADTTNGSTSKQRGFNAIIDSTGHSKITVFQGGAGTADTTSGTLATGGWYVVGCTVDTAALSIAAMLSGTLDAGTTVTSVNQFAGAMSILSRWGDGSSDPFIGYIHEIRVYDRVHGSTTMAAVVTEMT